MEYTKEYLRQIFQQPFCLDTWRGIVKNLFQDRELLIDPEEIEDPPDDIDGYFLGQFTTSDKYTVGLFHYKVLKGNVNRKKVGLRRLVHTFINERYGDFNAALVVFEGQGKWRLSFICDIKGLSTAPKRFTFVFGEEDKQYKTAVSRFIQLQRSKMEFADIKDAFSVEALSKDFYERLFQWYEWALSAKAGVTFPSNPQATSDEEESMSIKIIRLITRLLFVWFIKQKHLVPDSLFSPDYLKTVLKGFVKDSPTDGCYYNAILQNLFFATLNCPILEDKVPHRTFATVKGHRDTKNQYRYAEMFSINEKQVIEIFAKVPFLNGGLFDCLDKPKDLYLDLDHDILHDGFSRNATKDANGKHKYRAFVPNNLFFSEDEKQPGLITLLNEYNFTIEENSTDDAEISLDPELLGCVFENLLAAYNPETQESVRKSTGSFYTPRVVVDYMVDEALIAYLTGKNITGIEEADIRQLLRSHEKVGTWDNNQTATIEEALKRIKILDPACGSGAFPMGCLLRIVDVIEILHGGNINRYKEKLAIIKNCIYGGDIQSIAMLICKLRFFISLICELKDEDIDFSKPEDNFGVQTLPNLETKFVAANSLISAAIKEYDQGRINDPTLKQKKDELLEIREQHFQAKGRRAKRKCQEADKAKRKEIYDYLVDTMYKPNESLIAMYEAEIGKQKALRDSLKGKVYLDELDTDKQTDLFGYTSLFSRNINEEKSRDADRRIKNLEAEIKKERAKAGLKGFDAAVKQLTDWDPYDQNSVSPFFDPEWMFCLDSKFDIVIGNPPYIKEYTNKRAFDGFRETSPYYMGKMDLWYGFACHGLDLAVKLGGILCFIAQNNWTTSAGASLLRKKIVKECRISQILDFNELMVFGSASIQTMIMLFINDNKTDDYTIDYRFLKAGATISDMNKLLERQPSDKVEYLQPLFNRASFNEKYFTFSKEKDIFDKIAKNKEFLYSTEVAQGIVFPQDFLNKKSQGLLGHHKVGDGIFALTDIELEDLNLPEKEMSLIKPYYTSEQIYRYYVRKNSNELWMIYTDSSYKDSSKMCNYPALKKHLDTFIPILTSDNKPYGLHRARNNKFFIGEKVLSLRKCVHRPCFTYTDFDCYVTQTFFVIRTSRWNMKFLTGLLNSRLIAYWLRHKGKMQGENYQIDKEPLLNIPLPPPNVSQQEIIEQVDIILDKLSRDTLADIKEEEDTINKFVYKIYNLLPAEIDKIENS